MRAASRESENEEHQEHLCEKETRLERRRMRKSFAREMGVERDESDEYAGTRDEL